MLADGASEVFCDDKSAAKNSSTPNSVLNDIHNFIFYFWVREAQDADVLHIFGITGKLNMEY